MVVRLLTGKDIAGALNYNEQKVKLGDAHHLATGNFPDPEMALRSEMARREMLEFLASRNPRVEKPTIHLSLAFHPTEQLTDELLRRITQEFLNEAGYGKQPYVLYRHMDTAHPHVHVVTASVDRKGEKISDTFIKNRMNQIRQDIEKRFNLVEAQGQKPTIKLDDVEALPRRFRHQETKVVIEETLKRVLNQFSCSSFNDMKSLLAAYHIDARLIQRRVSGRDTNGIVFRLTDGIKPISVAIKASKLSIKPTYERLQTTFQQGAAHKREELTRMVNALNRELSAYRTLTEATFYSALRSVGIQVIEQNNAYLYVHHDRHVIWHESELGEPYSLKNLKSRFNDRSEKVQARIGEEEGKRLGKQVNDLYEAYRQQSAYSQESVLIDNFPFTQLVKKLQQEGVAMQQAIMAVRQFETYKQSKLPYIRVQEAEGLSQLAKPSEKVTKPSVTTELDARPDHNEENRNYRIKR